MDSNAVSPKDEGSHIYPFRMIVIAHFHEGLMYVEVFALNNAIGLGVVRGNIDVMDAIFSDRYPATATNAGLLSVTISATPPHW